MTDTIRDDAPAEERVAHLHRQIGALATVLMDEFGGPTQDESACEMAVRVLREQRDALHHQQAAKTTVPVRLPIDARDRLRALAKAEDKTIGVLMLEMTAERYHRLNRRTPEAQP